jgi:hypothetical protein
MIQTTSIPTPDRATALTIVIGSILFLAAAFAPISRVFAVRDSAQKLEIILGAPNQWVVAQLLFALGSLVTVVGIGMLAYRMSGHDVAVYLRISAAVMGIGALLWTWHVFVRAVEPALFTTGQIPVALFAGYSLLTIIGLALLGVALLQAGFQPWVAWLAMGSAALFLVLGLAFGDMPPLVYYLVTLTIGIVLFRAAPEVT